jgi:O-antigen ligase
VLGVVLVGLADRKSLKRIFLFGTIFAIVAQTVVLFTIDMNLVEVVVNRIQELETTTFSSRPYIYASTIQVIKAHPLFGVGLGAFRAHAPATPLGWVPMHSHNVYLAYAAEAGIPAAFFFTILVIRLLVMSVRNLRVTGRVPGYGFIALGSCGALLGLVTQTMAVQVFHQRILGFGFYALAAIVVALDRMIREGQFDEIESAEPGARSAASPWIGS